MMGALVILQCAKKKARSVSAKHSNCIGANANDDGMLIDRENLVRVSFAEHLDSR